MNRVILKFKANGQKLEPVGGKPFFASNTVDYIGAEFQLGDNWSGFDSVRAVWHTDFERVSTVLDASGWCVVPWEVLRRAQTVKVNLVGSISEDDVLTDRLTTYPVKALVVNANAVIEGTETAPVTPSQFEQFIEQVIEIVGSVKDIDRAELNADYTLTIYYSDGTSDTVGPIRGEQGPVGPDGNGISSITKIGSAGTNPVIDTYRIAYTNGTHTDFTVTNGVKGDTGAPGSDGNGIESIYLTETHGAVKTYTILLTNGDTYNYNVTDGEVTEAELQSVIESILPVDSASGSIASFPDGSNLVPMHSLVVDIEPVQSGSGTPSPDNVRPITGWTGCEVDVCGANVWDEEWEQGVLTWSGQNSDDGSTRIRSKNYIPCVAGAVYRIVTSANLQFFYYDSSKAFVSYESSSKTNGATITIPSGVSYFRFYTYQASYGATYKNDISINYPSTDTSYHAYNTDSDTYPVTWSDSAGTVYGGTVDVVSGVLTVDRAIYTPTAIQSVGQSNGKYYWVVTSTLTPPAPENNVADLISSHFVAGSVVMEGYCYITGLGKYIVATPADQTLNTKALADAWMESNNPQFCYLMKEPTTYQLTPQEIDCLLGQNNVWSNCGDVAVTYSADVQRYITKVTS